MITESDSQARTLTLGSYENGRLKVLTGGMGNWKLSFENSKHATIEWTFMGRYTPVIDAPMLSGVIRPTEPPIPFVGKDILIDGRPTGCLNSMSIESGNNVIIRPCAAEVGGVESGLITGRKITANFDPEACLIAEDDVYQSWLGGDEHAFEICLENENDLITFAGPRFQRTNIQDAEREGIDIDQTTGQFNIENGDDEFSITFGSPPTPPAPTVT